MMDDVKPHTDEAAMMAQPSPIAHRPWLHRYAMLLVAATFVLVASGGNVTSRDAGLAVPDGFTVYGYFLWAFPRDQWVGNIFHEHIHRLKGSAIGCMTIVLAVWMWRAFAHRGVTGGDWRRWLGAFALALVILQGAMGGLRVEFARWMPAMELPSRVAHAVTGQLFLCLTVLIAVVTSRLWHVRLFEAASPDLRSVGRGVRAACFVLLAALLLQLILGAAMRHTRSGMAIPDFPASYGSVIPPLTQAGIVDATDRLVPYDESPAGYYTPTQVGLAYSHRVWAIGVVAAAMVVLSRVSAVAREDGVVRAPLMALTMLLFVQVMLGAATIWSKLHPDIATTHQATGAAILATAVWLTLRVHLARIPSEPRAESQPVVATPSLPGVTA
jgi:cytochrome c oxidase assembly protein subunit 15